MKILALDVATQCGIAVGSSKGDPKCWSVNLGASVPKPRIEKMGQSEASIKRMRAAHKFTADNIRFLAVARLVEELLLEEEPDFIVIEAFIGGSNASAYLIGLVTCVRLCAANHAIKCEMVFPATVRKHFLGKAKTSNDFPNVTVAKAKLLIKEEVAARCKLLGWEVPDLDAADAAATWDWACAMRAPAYQAKPQGGMFK